MNNDKLIIGIFTIMLLFGGAVFGQDIVTDEDSLFGADESTEISTEEDSLFGSEDDMFSDNSELIYEFSDNQMTDLSSVLLTSDSGVEIGGDFFFDVTADWKGFDPGNLSGSDISDSFSLDLGATLFLVARPDKDSRVFTKAVISSPFYTTSGATGRKFEDIVTITELFADFNWDNRIFFQAGKQIVNWGVGHFFSPADLLSLSRIDPEDPDADLDGPIALKVHYPYLLDNYYLYTVIPVEADSYSDIAIAPKVEFVIGISEISVGTFYQYNKAPAAMTTITSAIGDVSVYGEGYVSYGSDKTFVDDEGLTLVTYNDIFFFKGTVGATYSWSDDLSNYNLSFSGQYLFNGEGYEDQDLLNTFGASFLSPSDFIETGRHYGAASVNWREMWGSDFSLSVFYIENFSSFSGMIKPSISWGGMDDIDISLSASGMFGDIGEEYSPFGSTAAVSLGVSIGGTSF